MASNNLKTVLAKEGIHQGDLAWASGISKGTINKVYNGRRTPAPTTMGRLAKGVNALVKEDKYEIKDLFPKAKL
jgi:DNA-binding XRE family transcriptional regulator